MAVGENSKGKEYSLNEYCRFVEEFEKALSGQDKAVVLDAIRWNEYHRAVRYCEERSPDGDDKRAWIRSAIIVLGSIVFGLLWGVFYGPFALEIVALLNTLWFGRLFFKDLIRIVQSPHFDGANVSSVKIGGRLRTCMAALWLALGALLVGKFDILGSAPLQLGAFRIPMPDLTYGVYLVAVIVSFYLFWRSDWDAAKGCRKLRESRTYWLLLLFDFPAFVAFVILLGYLGASYGARHYWGDVAEHVINSRHFVSGAIVVQMLFADIVVLLTLRNTPFVYFKLVSDNLEVTKAL
jgi:hypothetical protein